MASLLSLPVEIRFMIYRYLTPTKSICFAEREAIQQLHFNLLRANKQIYREYRRFLYSNIEIVFETLAAHIVALWLDLVGPQNAGLIRTIHIDFPGVYSKRKTDEMDIDENSLKILEYIKETCTGVRTLVMNLSSSYQQVTIIEYFETELPGFMAAAISELNKIFRGIPSVEMIKIEFPKQEQQIKIVREMERHGWVIEDIECQGWPEQFPYDMLNYWTYDDDYSDSGGYHYPDDVEEEHEEDDE